LLQVVVIEAKVVVEDFARDLVVGEDQQQFQDFEYPV